MNTPRLKKPLAERKCARCGKLFSPYRFWQRFCPQPAPCRMTAWRLTEAQKLLTDAGILDSPVFPQQSNWIDIGESQPTEVKADSKEIEK